MKLLAARITLPPKNLLSFQDDKKMVQKMEP